MAAAMSKNILGNNALSGFDNIFKGTEKGTDKIIIGNAGVDGESVVHTPLDELYPPDFHPFYVTEV